MYVETSAINNDSRSTNSAFEVSFSSEFIFRQISNKSQRRLLAWPPLGNSQGRHLHRGLSRGVGLAGGRQVNQGEDIWVLTHLDVLITRCSGGRVRLNCLAAMGGERGENYQQGRGRGENYQHLDLISNQSRSGSVSSVCNAITITFTVPITSIATITVSYQVSLQSKSSTLSSTTSETSSSERRASSTRASSNMVGSSAVSSPALSSATLPSGSSPVLKVIIVLIF